MLFSYLRKRAHNTDFTNKADMVRDSGDSLWPTLLENKASTAAEAEKSAVEGELPSLWCVKTIRIKRIVVETWRYGRGKERELVITS